MQIFALQTDLSQQEKQIRKAQKTTRWFGHSC